jgi:hypothetical protein
MVGLVHRQIPIHGLGGITECYDGETEHEVACPACTHALFEEGKDGEMEVKQESRGKLKYPDESGDDAWQDHSKTIIAVLENEHGKLN